MIQNQSGFTGPGAAPRPEFDFDDVARTLRMPGKAAIEKHLPAVLRSIERDLAATPDGVLRNDLSRARDLAATLSKSFVEGSKSKPVIAEAAVRPRPEAVAYGESLALSSLRIAVKAALQGAQRPTVLVDLDDTVFDASGRYIVCRRLMGEHYDLDTLRNAVRHHGSENDLQRAVAQEFEAKYPGRTAEELANEFSELADTLALVPGVDLVIPGAREYIHSLADAGAELVYLTARRELDAGANAALLRATGFPFGQRASIYTRPHGEDIVAYKKRVSDKLLATRTISAVLDDDGGQQKMFAEVLRESVRLTPRAGREDIERHLGGVLVDYTNDFHG